MTLDRRTGSILVTANDTGAGKTYVTAILALEFLKAGRTVEVMKTIETGVSGQHAGDAQWIASRLRIECPTGGRWRATTAERFTEAVAPVEAARREGRVLRFAELLNHVPLECSYDWRIIEGAGGISVPLESGPEPRDWADFARELSVDWVVLVVENRLGAINQARLIASYARSHSLNCGWWLNQTDPEVPEEVLTTNESTLRSLDFPLWGQTRYESNRPDSINADWLK